MCRCDDDNCHPMELLLPPLQCSPAVTKSCIHPKFKWSKCLKKPTPVLRCTLQACEQHLLLLKASLGFLKASATSGSCPLICQKQTNKQNKSTTFMYSSAAFLSPALSSLAVPFLQAINIYCLITFSVLQVGSATRTKLMRRPHKAPLVGAAIREPVLVTTPQKDFLSSSSSLIIIKAQKFNPFLM